MQYDAEMQKEEPDKEKIQQINTDITALYGTIIGGKSMTEYNEAFTAYNELCTKISNIILMCQNGEDPETCEPSSCTGNCGTCGGCDAMAETLALMDYMVKHNSAHAKELEALAQKLGELGNESAAQQVLAAVSEFEKGNLRLAAVLASLK